MPQITTPDGRTVYIPGVYTDTEIISALPGPLPAFQIPVILGSADFGRPYDYDDLREVTLEAEAGPFRFAGNTSAAASAFGRNSDLHKAMVFAARHGLTGAFMASLSALTRASVTVQSTGPIDQFDLVPRDFGALPGHVKVQFTAGPSTFTFTPVKQYAKVTEAYSAADTRIYVRDNSWIAEGQTITVGKNGAASEDLVVATKGSEIGTDGRPRFWVELTSGVTAGAILAEYPYLLEYDENRTETFTTTGSMQDLIDLVNDGSQLFLAVKAGTFDGSVPIALATATPLKDIAVWDAPVAGTSPAATPSDVTSLITQLNAKDWENFAIRFGLLPQAYLLVMPDSAAHLSFRDYALAERTRGFPISVTVGAEWGDVDLSAGDDTNPLVRSAALNSQDVALWAGGMDDEPSYLSFAPAVFGLRVRGGIAHNLTQDALRYDTLEVRWNEIGAGELSRLHRGGVGVYRLQHNPPYRFVVSQGLNTLQNNSGLVFNEQTKETWSLYQRDLVDFIDRVLSDDLRQSQLGADAVTEQSIAQVLVRRAQVSLEPRGYIVPGSHQVLSVAINEGANGFDAVQTYRTPTVADFITVTSQILIG